MPSHARREHSHRPLRSVGNDVVATAPARSSSLVLADNTLEELLEDLERFYRSRSWYVRQGHSAPAGLFAARSSG